MKILSLLPVVFLLIFVACNEDSDNHLSDTGYSIAEETLTVEELPERFAAHRGFQLLSPEETGVTFENTIRENYDYNILTYEYLYNGGGVAVGDINGNGLPDLYFVSTFGRNRLYLNKGNFEFEDITNQAGVGAPGGFKTGATMVDINGNGLLDIYVSRTGKDDGPFKRNLLYINNGDLTFTEMAADFGLDLADNSNHVNFFDMDGNGYLDVYVLNHPLIFSESANIRLRENPDGSLERLTSPRTDYDSDRLLRNVNGRFEDISESAGVLNSAFGLSVIVADINMNGLPDIFVGNDFIEPDHLYINNGDGTFTDKAMEYFNAMSENSMGADIADFTNNGLPDIVVLDMLAEDHVRYKELSNIMKVSRRNLLMEYGYGFQYLRNVLQQNRGVNSDGKLEFSEISRLAGVHATDWSWGALFADFDNDGWKDLYIANGYLRDVTDLDYTTYTRDSIERTGGVYRGRFPNINEFLDMIPTTPLPNYMYLNNGDLTFFNATSHWNIDQPSISSGSVYADLNGDGNLDLVVSNINSPAFIKRNLGSDNNYLQITLKGPGNNTRGIGAKAWATTGDLTQYLEMNGNRGFLSTSEHMFHFGLGQADVVEELLIVWPDNTYQKLTNIDANQRIHVEYSPEGRFNYPDLKTEDRYFLDITGVVGIDFVHEENDFEDLNRERLLPHRLSRLGPAVAVADVTGNGMDDVFIGGAEGQASALYLQGADGTFTRQVVPAFETDFMYEDVDASFLDVNGNGLPDLIVLSGGYAHGVNNPLYNDRLYMNKGDGNFERSTSFPNIPSCSGPLLVHDFEGGGEPFIFSGGRALPLNYPLPPVSYILQNRNGDLTNVTSRVLPEFDRLGMITTIKAADITGNGTDELIVTGEWMPIHVFSWTGDRFEEITADLGLDKTHGWWNTLLIEDLTGDGKMEIVGGNLGLNARFKASHSKPLLMFADDFDNNGMIDPIMAYVKGGKVYPYPGRDLLLTQLPLWRRQFPRYQHYSNATIEEVLSPDQIENALKMEVYHLESSIFFLKDGKYVPQPLPLEAQVSIVFDIKSGDFNGDGNLDLLLVGNHLWPEPESAAYDASKGVLLLGNGDGSFDFMENRYHGLWASGEARKLKKINIQNQGESFILINNNEGMKVFKIQNQGPPL